MLKSPDLIIRSLDSLDICDRTWDYSMYEILQNSLKMFEHLDRAIFIKVISLWIMEFIMVFGFIRTKYVPDRFCVLGFYIILPWLWITFYLDLMFHIFNISEEFIYSSELCRSCMRVENLVVPTVATLFQVVYMVLAYLLLMLCQRYALSSLTFCLFFFVIYFLRIWLWNMFLFGCICIF